MSSRIKRRPTIWMPHWDVRLATLLTKRNYPCVGRYSNCPYDLALFVDGPPVSPVFYGEAKLGSIKCSLQRDREDASAFRQLKAHTPKLGIGRGAHFLNIMNGGGAWQSVDNHIGPHRTTCFLTGTVRYLSSNHSQLMLPRDDADLLCVAQEARHLYGDQHDLHRSDMKDALDVEACYYLSTNSLCFQPDAQAGHEDTITYLETLMHECLVLNNSGVTCEP